MKRNEIHIATPDWGLGFTRPVMYMGGLPLTNMPVSKQLIIPLRQRHGQSGQWLVQVGDFVQKGQPVSKLKDSATTAIVHAPTSGQITDIVEHPAPGLPTGPCLLLTADNQDTPWPGSKPIPDPLNAKPDELLTAVTAAGITGLGGAEFPTNVKLQRKPSIETLILNGVECEPRINCDDALMSHHADEMLLGAQLLMKITGAMECIVAIKSDAIVALDVLRSALARLGDARFRLAQAPPVYPAGGELQLIKLLTGKTVPAGDLPQDIGMLCQNVATAAAVARCITTGEPLISRIVTVTGSAISTPQNILVRLGTPIRELINFAGGYNTTQAHLSVGGPMMGIELPDDSLPVTAGTNCILADQTAPDPSPAMPCIRCGDCATVCPVALTPQLLLQVNLVSDFEQLERLGLNQCIECGCCDYVCPSQIPLTSTFAQAKKMAADIHFDQARASKAEKRFKAHNERLERQANTQEKITEPANADTKAALESLLERVANKNDNKRS